MQISKMIDILLRNIAKKYKATLIEMKTYKDDKVYKSYRVKIGNINKEFKNQTDLLLYLKEWK